MGRRGPGTLDIIGGAQASGSTARVGRYTGATGDVLISGANSLWTLSQELEVGGDFNFNQPGGAGVGTVTVENGGRLVSRRGNIGTGADSEGSVTINGPDSSWAMNNGMAIGEAGIGRLNILAGAQVSNGSKPTLGSNSAGEGYVTVSGAGSLWTVSDLSGEALRVGNSGRGELLVEDGGRVLVTGKDVLISSNGPSLATVTGSGSRLEARDIHVGSNVGNGTLRAGDGAVVTSSFVSISITANSTGRIVMEQGGLLEVQGSLRIGSVGTGRVDLGGGTISTGLGGQNNRVNIAFASGTTGVLNVGAAAGDPPVAPGVLNSTLALFGPGAGRIVFNHNSGGYQFAPAISGQGAIDVLAGTTTIGTESNLFSGPVAISGGRLNVNGVLGGTVAVEAGGVLGGAGSVGPVTVSGGTVSPGGSVGTLSVSGALNLGNGSVMEIEIGAAGAADLISTSGAASLGGSTLRLLAPEPAVSYPAAQSYTILTAGGGITGQYGNAAPGTRLDTADGRGSFLVNYGAGNSVVLSGFEANPDAPPGGGQASVTSIVLSPTQVTIEWESFGDGMNYQFETSQTLLPNSWTPIGIPVTNGGTSVVLPRPAGSPHFFRLRSP